MTSDFIALTSKFFGKLTVMIKYRCKMMVCQVKYVVLIFIDTYFQYVRIKIKGY